jgi:hypothetical protein
MRMLSQDVLKELVAKPGRYLQWEMPYPHGTLKDNYFTLRNPDGTAFLVLGSACREIIEDFLRQSIVHKDEKASKPGCWVYVPTPRAAEVAA